MRGTRDAFRTKIKTWKKARKICMPPNIRKIKSRLATSSQKSAVLKAASSKEILMKALSSQP